MAIRTEILTSLTAWQAIQADWHDLWQRSTQPEIFLTSGFQLSWWQTLGQGQLAVVLVWDESQLIGLAPLQISKDKTASQLGFVGCKAVSDYLGILVDRHQENMVLEAVWSVIASLDWVRAEFCSLRASNRLLTTWSNLATQGNFAVEQLQQDVCPRITLPATWEEYLAQLHRKQRHEVRRKAARLHDQGLVEYECITQPQPTDIEDFIRLHRLSGAEKAKFWHQDHLDFFHLALPAIARQNWLKLFFLRLDQVRVASEIVFDTGQEYQLYNSGFDPAASHVGTGAVLTAHTIRTAIEQGKGSYDFLRGSENYKYRLGGVDQPIFDLKIERRPAAS